MDKSNWSYKKLPQASSNFGVPVTNSKPISNKSTSNIMPETMKVVNSPGHEQALTNKIYCSPNDFRHFPGRLVLLSNPNASQVQHVLTVESYSNLQDGTLGLNGIHRKNIRVSTNDDVAVSNYLPEKGSEVVILTVELEFIKFKGKQETLDANTLSQKLKSQFNGQVMTVGQKVSFEYVGTNYFFTVVAAILGGNPAREANRGLLTEDTNIMFETAGNSGIKIVNQKGGGGSNLFKAKDFNFQKLGIGGLDTEFQDIFRRAFASRIYSTELISRLGIQHVKGMLLWGPPGTGKTLIARQIGKMLNGKEPKIVNGPEVLSKFVGETEKNIRDLFAEAESDQKSNGDQSELHIIIFDEIDAICKSRGTTRDGTGVHDSIVNQLLTKIDGVESLNNILLIGMTNRKDMLDEALLRPGRLEVQIEIGLPDEHGRVQILQIHSSKMRENSFLSADVSVEELAAQTKNFSGAELEGLVKSAVSFALNRQINYEDLNNPLDEENVKVTKSDFLAALNEVKPAFGAAVTSLERCRGGFPVLNCGQQNSHAQRTVTALVEQLKTRADPPVLSCLLEGPSGSGKTALAAIVALRSTDSVPFIKIISAETMVGLSESTKCGMINKVFEDAYKSPLSIIILDDIERLLEYVNIGPRFSNLILQTLLVLTKRLPPEGRKLLVIGTTSMTRVMVDMDVQTAFDITLHVPSLTQDDIRRILEGLDAFGPGDLDKAMSILPDQMPVKKLLYLLSMSNERGTADDDTPLDFSESKVDINRFRDYYNDLSRYSTWSD